MESILQNRYTLSHRDVPVADVLLEDGHFKAILAVHDVAHAPIGTNSLVRDLDAGKLRDWFSRRHIPRLRTNVESLLSERGFTNPDSFVESTLALSLSDTYWLRPFGSTVRWADVNLFENDFSTRDHRTHRTQRVVNPDASTSGDQEKIWKIGRDDRRYLVKYGREASSQQPFDEEIGSRFCERLGIEHVRYRAMVVGGREASVCPCALDEKHDYVCAYDILQSQTIPYPRTDNDVFWLREQYERHGVDADAAFSEMALVDACLRNEDRHWTNFGIVRDAETLEWVGVFPLYDFGNSLFFDSEPSERDAVSRFSHVTLMHDLTFVKEIDSRQAEALASLPELIRSVLGKSHIDERRAEAIAMTVRKRADVALNTIPIKEGPCTETNQRQRSTNGLTSSTRKSRPSTSDKVSGVPSRTSGDAAPCSRRESSQSCTSSRTTESTSKAASSARILSPVSEATSAPTSSTGYEDSTPTF